MKNNIEWGDSIRESKDKDRITLDKLKEYLNERKETLHRYYTDTNVYDGAVISYGGLKEINMLLKWLEKNAND